MRDSADDTLTADPPMELYPDLQVSVTVLASFMSC